ncbi:MAG: glycogen synthase GlgA [Gammaproteobacteria bacterium]|nr:glycogen synthase GlgA [Gammaproteobacteria bacterium]
MNILFAASEAHPLVKTGGLADVAGALPAALRRLGEDARLIMPAYRGVAEAAGAAAITGEMGLLTGAPPARLLRGTLPGSDVPLYLVEAAGLYDRDGGPYASAGGLEWPDNALRFALLARAAALYGQYDGVEGWRADIVHCNDWQTGLTPAYLAHAEGPVARTVMGIHNLAFQGNFPPAVLPLVDLPPSSYQVHGSEFYGNLSYLKAGIYYADRIITVSPTYAREIQTAEFGFGMEGLLAARSAVLSGILNGIDTDYWNPAADEHVPAAYDAMDLAGKDTNRRALEQYFGLETHTDTPLLGMVTRLTWQKGIDLALEALPQLLDQGARLVVVGSGEARYEERLQALASEYPGRIGVHVGYSEPLAHLVEAGADLFLMPSRFEPCGLNQMYSMRYGTPPVVRHTGGLADSVVDTTFRTLQDGTATGFVFVNASAEALQEALMRALILWRDKSSFEALCRQGMARDFSWEKSARAYLSAYVDMPAGGG